VNDVNGARASVAAFIVAFVVACSGVAHADPIRTWGSSQTPPPPNPSARGDGDGAGPPPSPPPATIGTPIEPSDSAPPAPPSAGDTEAVVRAPGRVGLRYVLEGIEVRGNTATLSRVVLRYVPFRSGDTIDVDDKEIELTRFRLLGTGFFREVNLSLRRGSHRGYAILVITVAERNTIVLNNVWLGLSADADPNGAARPLTAYGGLDVAETNLAGTGITLGGAIAIADGQLALRTRFADPAFLGTSWTVETQLLYNHARDFFGNEDVLVDDPTQQVTQDFAVANYTRFGGSLGAGHDIGLSTQLYVDYRLEKLDASLPLAASDHYGNEIVPIDFYILPGSSILSTVRATLIHDTRDEPVLATRGDFFTLIGDVSLTPLGSDYPYSKIQARLSHWIPLPWGGGGHVLKLDAFAGAIFGNAPLFEKFYIGDFTDLLPDRVLDLNFDRRSAPNFLNTDISEIRYGNYALKLSAEYRVPLYRGSRSIYGIDFFGSLGAYSVADQNLITNPPPGYTGFAKIPVDLTFNFGLRADTAIGGFMFGVSNFLGFLPVRGAAPQ
jgi:outer membrane protein assembly factor BamA